MIPPGWRPPARRPPRPATRPTAPSKASSPPAPRPPHRPTGDAGAAAHLHGPDQLFADALPEVLPDVLADVIPLPIAAAPHAPPPPTTTGAPTSPTALTSNTDAS